MDRWCYHSLGSGNAEKGELVVGERQVQHLPHLMCPVRDTRGAFGERALTRCGWLGGSSALDMSQGAGSSEWS